MDSIDNRAQFEGPSSKPIKAHSNVPLNYNLAGTYRFGQNQVCFVADTVPDDVIRLNSAHELRSMNMEAPLLGDIYMSKDFFDVPLDAILPENVDKLLKQPNKGEDIDAQEVGTNIEGFYRKIFVKWGYLVQEIHDQIIAELEKETPDYELLGKVYGTAFQLVAALEKIYSKGSLSAAMGKNVGGMITYNDISGATEITGNFQDSDAVINKFYEYLIEKFESVQGIIGDATTNTQLIIDGRVYFWHTNASYNDKTYLNNRQALEKIKEGTVVRFLFGDYDDANTMLTALADGLNDIIDYTICSAVSQTDKPICIKRELAYQLVNAEYYTNSHIDYTYSAELYRQAIASLIYSSDEGMGETRDMFSWNGTDYYYDILSAHSLSLGFFHVPRAGKELEDIELWCSLIDMIFGYRRSLRYVDYYTGGRTNPLAVGDLGIKVNDGYVNVVESIEKTWAARFLNQVNRIGNKAYDYYKGMFPGLVRHRDFHEPLWLAKIRDQVYTSETENTGEAQMTEENSTTTTLHASGAQHTFEYNSERYGVCIGIIYFDIKRYYGDVIERPNFWVDRNDYFNPYLQFIGDQALYADELNARLPHNQNFAYKGRYIEYRERVDQCFGGLSNGRLKGWLFEAPDYEDKLTHAYISPDYIRSRPSELDQYFNKLTGYCDGYYFHFIIINTNTCNMDREMVANPQIW